MKTKQEPAQSRLHTMPTHVPSHHRASPFLDDVIINQAVEKDCQGPGAIFKYNDMCFHPDSRQKGVGDVLLSE